MIDLDGPGTTRWRDDPQGYWESIDAAASGRARPAFVVELDALRHNAADLVRRAGGRPLRLATKSVRIRAVIEAALELDAVTSLLAYDLAEALWLVRHRPGVDVLVGYPSVDPAEIAELTSTDAATTVTLLVDSVAHLDIIDAARGTVPAGRRRELRVAIDLDASYRSRVFGLVGVHRSPVHEVGEARELAEAVAARPGVRLVGAMSYEAQLAGIGDAARPVPAGRWSLRNRSVTGLATSRVVRTLQDASRDELVGRRAAQVAALAQVADLEFVNGGGTGSLEWTAADPAVTDLAFGSGLLGGHFFDGYRAFTPAPAAAFGLAVARKPSPRIATCHGGGWIASGPPGADRLPRPVWLEGLRYLGREAAGEVQTPLAGRAARRLQAGDTVWFRHAKSGEVCEHVRTALLVAGGVAVGEVPTYRGEGRCFL